MPYSLLIGLGAGLVSAVVFASATTGPLLMRMILFLLTPLALFLAGLGVGPATAAIAGLAGTAVVFAAGSATAALVFATSQAIPVSVLTYLAALNRPVGEGGMVPAGPPGDCCRADRRRLLDADVVPSGREHRCAARLVARHARRFRQYRVAQDARCPNARAQGDRRGDRRGARPAAGRLRASRPWAACCSICGWRDGLRWRRAGCSAPGPIWRPCPIQRARRCCSPWRRGGLLSGLSGLIAAGFAGPLFFAYVLLGLAVVHYVTRGRPWRPFALWGLYAALFIMNTVASLAIALLGLAEAIWPIRRMAAPRNDPPSHRNRERRKELPHGGHTASAHRPSRPDGRCRQRQDGYARNFPPPQKKALRATAETRARFETQRAQLEANNLELKKEAQAVSGKLNGKIFVAIRSAGDTGQLYGSVSTRDIAEVVTAGGFTIERRQVILEMPIKTLGLHDHARRPCIPQVIVKVTLNVARSEDEAKHQTARRGRDRGQGGEAGARDLRTRRCSRRAPPLPRMAGRLPRRRPRARRPDVGLCCPNSGGQANFAFPLWISVAGLYGA